MATVLSDDGKHVVVIAFPFGSHPLALLNQAIRLARAAPNIAFSFINTEKSNQSLFSKQPNIPQNIKPYTVSDGVPDQDHVPGTLPLPGPVLVDLFLQASLENLEQAIDLAVKSTNQRVACILSDTFVSSPSLSLSHKLNVPYIAAWPSLSISVSPHFYTHLIRQKITNSHEPNKNTYLDFLPGLSHLRVEDLPPDVLLKTGEEHKETVFSKILASSGQVLPQARALVLCSYEELDPPLFVQDLKSKLKSLLYIGPPLSRPDSADPNGCLPWLDKQGSRSVVYISFGTVVAPPQQELVEVSEALEASGFPFLWSLKDDQKRLLPNGFVEGTSMIGKIVPWAPQTQVLAHGSVGVFVTHCGSNSVMEGLANGVPMICRPFFGDHGMAARTVVDLWRIGVKTQGGVFTKSGLLQSLNLILVEEQGKEIRENALKMKKTMQIAGGADGKAAQDFKTLVEIITSS
ncbi:anthocyanidin 3-O-glucosyltransferase 7-like [Prosopis cineraria]|uniref:anthocyanidin 3-O-glucosyltransferase 7-like n=1 Tax=Prosopis cineraria TaxID=364024 RepID=UPI00240FB57B|nr:anthocyanidin 3-O-glucosyltransferase 7-like [Prosopis cineraria]